MVPVLDATGLRHSDQLHLQERFQLFRENGLEYLQVDSTLTDEKSFLQPVHTTRVFRRSDFTEPAEITPHCLMNQWRTYLESHNSELRQRLEANDAEAAP